MSLMLARVGNSFSQPGARVALGAVTGAAVTTGTIVAAQYANGEDFSKASGIPNPISWGGGTGAVLAGASIITGGVLSQPGEYGRAAWKGGYTLAGAGIGIAASTFLLTPVMRRFMSDQ